MFKLYLTFCNYLIFSALGYPWLHPEWVIGTMPSHYPLPLFTLSFDHNYHPKFLWRYPNSSFQSFSKFLSLQEGFPDSPGRGNLSILWPDSTSSVPLLWHHNSLSCPTVIYLYVLPPLPDCKLIEATQSFECGERRLDPERDRGEEEEKCDTNA